MVERKQFGGLHTLFPKILDQPWLPRPVKNVFRLAMVELLSGNNNCTFNYNQLLLFFLAAVIC